MTDSMFTCYRKMGRITFVLSSNYIVNQVPFWFQLPNEKENTF